MTVESDEASRSATNPDAAAVKAAAPADNPAPKANLRAAPLKFPFPAKARPGRRDKILANLDVAALEGVEIGALASPLVRPGEGDIFFVDHTGTQRLQDKYRGDPAVDIANIVHVDAVWGSQTLQECVGLDKKVDYVVASHVIEHVPDLVTWLAEIRSILRSNGTLRLAIPDRRYTFDYLRLESRIHDALDAYLQRARAPTPRQIIDHCSLIRVVDCVAAWNGALDVANLRPHSSTEVGFALARDAIANGSYHDSHCWVFTPLSFAELCREMASLDLLHFSCDRHFETARNQLEFFVHMAPSDSKADTVASWERMRTSLLLSKTYQRSDRAGAAGRMIAMRCRMIVTHARRIARKSLGVALKRWR